MAKNYESIMRDYEKQRNEIRGKIAYGTYTISDVSRLAEIDKLQRQLVAKMHQDVETQEERMLRTNNLTKGEKTMTIETKTITCKVTDTLSKSGLMRKVEIEGAKKGCGFFIPNFFVDVAIAPGTEFSINMPVAPTPEPVPEPEKPVKRKAAKAETSDLDDLLEPEKTKATAYTTNQVKLLKALELTDIPVTKNGGLYSCGAAKIRHAATRLADKLGKPLDVIYSALRSNSIAK